MTSTLTTSALASWVALTLGLACAVGSNEPLGIESTSQSLSVDAPTEVDFHLGCWFLGERIESVSDSEDVHHTLVSGPEGWGAKTCQFHVSNDSFDPYSVTIARWDLNYRRHTYYNFDYVVALGQAFKVERLEAKRARTFLKLKALRGSWVAV